MYRTITPSGPALWTGSLSDRLHHISLMLSSQKSGKSVTVAQAMAAGYSIQKKEAV